MRSNGERSAGQGDKSEVGYKKPPMATRFQPGRSGNPKGRPKRAMNFDTLLGQMLAGRTTGRAPGRRKVSRLEATIEALVDKAIAGDLQALRLILSLMAAHDTTAEPRSERRNVVEQTAEVPETSEVPGMPEVPEMPKPRRLRPVIVPLEELGAPTVIYPIPGMPVLSFPVKAFNIPVPGAKKKKDTNESKD